jgi:ATP-dependent Clp protease ATP-binding subunit ClpA
LELVTPHVRNHLFGEHAHGGFSVVGGRAASAAGLPHPRAAQDPEGKYEALAKYARDLTEAARDGKLDPVIGRDDEIRRCIQILSRRTKNNPVLIGEPGVGKTAVAEGARPPAGGA